jgi:ent-copalyl diphosphate synthase
MVHDKQTCLLLARMIEISAGRAAGEAASEDGDRRIIQLTGSICDSLKQKMLVSQV